MNVSLFARRRRENSHPDPFRISGVDGVWDGGPPGPAPTLVLDALGRKCPIPIIMVAERIREVPIGEIIAVRADDPAAYSDIPSWCGLKSHELAYREGLERGWEFGIRRTY